MNKSLKLTEKTTEGYREESPKTAIMITVFSVILVGAPLAYANKKIDDQGSRAADTSRYAKLTSKIEQNVGYVKEVLGKGVVREAILSKTGILANRGTTLITPNIVPTNLSEATKNQNDLDVVLSAIYWSAADPLVTIDDENYHVGDKVNGFTILEIRKTEVVFRSPAGEKVVKYFYDYL